MYISMAVLLQTYWKVFEELLTDTDCPDEPVLATQMKTHLKDVQITGPLELISKVAVFEANSYISKGNHK